VDSCSSSQILSLRTSHGHRRTKPSRIASLREALIFMGVLMMRARTGVGGGFRSTTDSNTATGHQAGPTCRRTCTEKTRELCPSSGIWVPHVILCLRNNGFASQPHTPMCCSPRAPPRRRLRRAASPLNPNPRLGGLRREWGGIEPAACGGGGDGG
jgi:hypothetical protein